MHTHARTHTCLFFLTIQEFRGCGLNPTPIVGRNYTARSCVEHMEHGASQCGYYVIHNKQESYVVFCDINTEIGFAYTLIESFALKRNAFFASKSLAVNWPINENSPNWNMYRLSHSRMSLLRDRSTYWRATCNFPFVGIDYQDYVRARITDVDPIKETLSATCKKVEYINLRGDLGLQTTVAFWNQNEYHMHTDSSLKLCAFGPNAGAVSSEDNWGYYGTINPKFRCTATADSTTQYWLGDYIRGNVSRQQNGY